MKYCEVEAKLRHQRASTISGGLSSDRINGAAGNDTLNGNEGSDTFDGGTSNDKINGSTGIDIALYSGSTAVVSTSAARPTGSPRGAPWRR